MIRKIRKEDKEAYLEMSTAFYSSEAVCHNVPGKYLADTFDELMRSDNYEIGYIFEYQNNIAGYALLSKTFSQEAGGLVVWIDELYSKPEYRCHGLGHEFFNFIIDNLKPDIKRIRLEVRENNVKAISLYKKMKFDKLPYLQMIKDH